jgi:hypothetical protein
MEATSGRAGADKTQEHGFCVDINEGTNCVKERSGVDSVEIRLVTSSYSSHVLFCCIPRRLHAFVSHLH